ncbi:MAG: radical SAM protein [Candidatus Altiarchaeales archaeon]|nr:radical SAM protein [Candidatus Altiarchaeales archaeon]MBD3416245.1 radical SAM protein [Candidatus Altiarchaeales archaeon]
MDVRLTCLNPMAYSVTPLGLGYINASLKHAGHTSTIQLFERQEQLIYDSILSMDYFGEKSPLLGIPKYLEWVELISGELFAQELGFVDRGGESIHIRFPKEVNTILGECNIVADRLSDSDVIGFGVQSQSVGIILYLAQAIKENNKKAKIILGGPVTELLIGVFYPMNFLHNSIRDSLKKSGVFSKYRDFLFENVDYIVYGEGEDSIVEIVNGIEGGTFPTDIRGTSSIRDGEIFSPGPREPINLDDLPYPDFEGIDMRRYSHLSFHISRGCIGGCKFCDERRFFKSFRVREPEKVLDELTLNSKKYGINRFLSGDSLLNGDPSALKKLCQLIIDSGLKIDWGGFMRLPQTDEELIDLLYDSGFRRPKFGLESLDQEVIDDIQKGQTIDYVKRILKYCREKGMAVTTTYMVGYPGYGIEYELSNIPKVSEVRNLYDYMALELINVGIRADIAYDPIKHGFEVLSTCEFDKGIWEYYTMGRSYIPGVVTYTRDSLSRKESELLFIEYSKQALLTKDNIEYMLYKHKLGWLKRLREYMPFEISNWLRTKYLEKEACL